MKLTFIIERPMNHWWRGSLGPLPISSQRKTDDNSAWTSMIVVGQDDDSLIIEKIQGRARSGMHADLLVNGGGWCSCTDEMKILTLLLLSTTSQIATTISCSQSTYWKGPIGMPKFLIYSIFWKDQYQEWIHTDELLQVFLLNCPCCSGCFFFLKI